MKKIIFILVLVNFFTKFSFSQTYSFKKIYSDGQLVKIKGSVSISDTLIIINTNGTISNLSVKKEMDNMQGTSTYRLIVPEKSETEMRITFAPSGKDEEQILNLEMKDTFNQKISNISYFLKKEEE